MFENIFLSVSVGNNTCIQVGNNTTDRFLCFSVHMCIKMIANKMIILYKCFAKLVQIYFVH